MDRDLEAFCRAEQPRLLGALTLVCGDTAVAEDLTQETLATVCRTWAKMRRLDAPGAYAHRIAMNAAASHWRRRLAERRAVRRSGRPPQWYADADGADAVAVRAALRDLDPKHRRVLVARFYLGYDVAGTAALLGLPVGTVKTYSARGLAALRATLGPSPDEEAAVDA